MELFDGQRLDLEGIALGPKNPDGTRSFWLGSEGQAPDDDDPTEPVRENFALKVNVDLSSGIGVVQETIALPEDLVDQRRGNGIEGTAVTGEAGSEVVHLVIQRAWPNEGDTDKVNTKIGRYEVATGQWTFVHYPLEPESEGDDNWIGLSGITAMPNGKSWVIERDKGWGKSTEPNAERKAIFEVALASADFRPHGAPLETIEKTLVKDLTSTIAANSIWTAQKLEGFAISADMQLYAVTHNDGVDDAPGETVFLQLGDYYSFGNDAKPPKHKKWKWWKRAWQGHED